jgi:tetratricopeptide (TPR) repeat protein
MVRRLTAVALGATALLAACSSVPPPAPAPAPAATPATPSIIALYQQPAERALIDGIRLYEQAAFEKSEASLKQALRDGLADRRDRAVAYKYLAFISCAFGRPAECEANFSAAFDADPDFALNDKEVGHPIWGPVYRAVAAARVQ